MISKIFGLIDLIAAFLLLLAGFDIVFTGLFVLFLLIILGKSLIFITSWASWIDLIVVLMMALVLIDIYSFLNILAVLWLLQKGIVSLFS